MQNKGLLYILIALLGFSACAKKAETQEEYLQRALEEKIQKHKTRKTEKCVEDLYQKASVIADSILLQEALKLDSLQDELPVIPPKPSFIEPRPSGDSLPTLPFLDSIDSPNN